MKEPVAIVTRDHQVVPFSSVKQYTTKTSSKQIMADPFANLYGSYGLVEPFYKFGQLAQLMELNTFHSRCVKTKARDTAGNGWELKPVENLQREASKDQYTAGYDFLSNQWPPLSTSLDKMMNDYDSLGNGFLELVREGDNPAGPFGLVTQVPGHTVRIHGDYNKFAQVRGVKRRWFKRVGYEKDVNLDDGTEKDLGTMEPSKRASEMIQLATYHPRSDYYGIPDIIPALGAIIGTIAARDYNIKFFSNFGVPAYAVYITGDYDLGVKDEHGDYPLVKEIKGYFAKLTREPHSTLFFAIPSDAGGTVDVKVVPLAVEVKEASFKIYRRDNRDEVIVSHGVPPYRVGIDETGSLGGSTATESTAIYIQSVINPRQEMIEQHFNRFILPALDVTDWQFKLKPVDTSQEEHDQAIADFLFTNGSMTPNNLIRFFGARFGLEPDENNPALNSYFVAGQPVDALLAGPPAAVGKEAEMVQSIKSLHDRLVDIAMKSGGNGE
jgi:PBSX family phage portal protein